MEVKEKVKERIDELEYFYETDYFVEFTKLEMQQEKLKEKWHEVRKQIALLKEVNSTFGGKNE